MTTVSRNTTDEQLEKQLILTIDKGSVIPLMADPFLLQTFNTI